MDSKQNKTICLPFASEDDYKLIVEDKQAFREYILKIYHENPELFPADIQEGFSLHGFVISAKQGLKTRRIRLMKNGEAYQIRPSFMMPYMIGLTDEIEKALFLCRWGVSFEALAYVFGHDPMFWYRAYISLGYNSIVGTTIKDPQLLPEDVATDEKHTRLKSEKVFAATTAADGCILGVGLAESASTKDLTKAYAEFKEEAQNLQPGYEPETVCTDGWEPTQNAWKVLFPSIIVILCYLHSFLKIRDRCRRCKDVYELVKEKVWHTYHAETLAEFAQRIRRLRDWAQGVSLIASVKEKILDLCSKSDRFKIAYDYPQAYRTSNVVDRVMNYMDRVLYAMQYFHGNTASTRLYLRTMALIWNFHPYGRQTRREHPGRCSPFMDINGFVYHENWLHNLLIAASLGGRRS